MKHKHVFPLKTCIKCQLNLVEDQGRIIAALFNRFDRLQELRPDIAPLLILIEEQYPICLK